MSKRLALYTLALVLVQVATAQNGEVIEYKEIEESEAYSEDNTYDENGNEIYTDDYRKVYSSNTVADYKYASTDYKERYTGEQFEYNELKEKAINNSSLPNLVPLLQIIFYLFCGLAIGLIVFLLYKFFSNLNLEARTKLKPVTYNESETGLPKKVEIDPEDLAARIADAKAAGDFALATRFYFLLYLQKLQQKDLIRYHQDKTNADYLAELKNDSITSQFIRVSHLFEYVWYGKKPINATSYATIETLFNDQIAAIR
jgi:hypothetical protein